MVIEACLACPSGSYWVGIGVSSLGGRRGIQPVPTNSHNDHQERPIFMASESHESALLPAGIVDELPPHAAVEAASMEKVIQVLSSHGYERVKPPLIEFEQSLLDGLGAAVTDQTFRLMDPVSQRMMGLRADMTPQIARIAATRLASSPRPLRLCYAGQVVRVKGSQLRPERQFTQVGAELIGNASAAADAEIICLAAESLEILGIGNISIDLGLPTLVPSVCREFTGNRPMMTKLRESLDRKDAASVQAMAPEIGSSVVDVLLGMMSATGGAGTALSKLTELNLDDESRGHLSLLADVVHTISRRNTTLRLTIDPIENRGFEYHTGVACTMFGHGVRGELGRGGRYVASAAGSTPQPATGFTLFMDSVMRAVPMEVTQSRLYIPYGFDPAEGRRRRAEGWTVVEGLEPCDDPAFEARRLNCDHLASQDGIEDLSELNGD